MSKTSRAYALQEITMKALIIDGHPSANSFSQALADAYTAALLQQGHTADVLRVRELHFNPNQDPRSEDPLEDDLTQAQHRIAQADHLVWVYPIWWGMMPGGLKVFLDRVLLPGFAFRYQSGKAFPAQLLKGRTARVIVTMDAPVFWNRWFNGNPNARAMRRPILEFCGIRPVRFTEFGQLRSSTPAQREKMLARVRKDAISDAKAPRPARSLPSGLDT